MTECVAKIITGSNDEDRIAQIVKNTKIKWISTIRNNTCWQDVLKHDILNKVKEVYIIS